MANPETLESVKAQRDELLRALHKFFDAIGYDKWCGRAMSIDVTLSNERGDRWALGTRNFTELWDAFNAQRVKATRIFWWDESQECFRDNDDASSHTKLRDVPPWSDGSYVLITYGLHGPKFEVNLQQAAAAALKALSAQFGNWK